MTGAAYAVTDETALREAIRACAASGTGLRPTGGSAPIPGLGEAHAQVSLAAMNAIVEHEVQDLTVTCEAGCTVASLHAALAEHGQRVALEPPHPQRSTVGGVIAARTEGFVRAAFGPVRDQILGMRVATAAGEIIQTGGRVVKNVTGYDLAKLFTGSHGTLGVIASVTLRLRAMPAAAATLAIRRDDADSAFETALALRDLGGTISGLAVAGGMAVGDDDGPWRVLVRLEGHPAALDDLRRRVTETAGAPEDVAEADGLWQALTDFPWEQVFAARVHVPPSRLPTAHERIRVSSETPSYGCVADVMNGVLWFTLPGIRRDVDTTVGDLALAAVVRDLRGVAAIPTDPDDVPERYPRFGWPDAAVVALMQRIKEGFDPDGLMAPGTGMLTRR